MHGTMYETSKQQRQEKIAVESFNAVQNVLTVRKQLRETSKEKHGSYTFHEIVSIAMLISLLQTT